MEVTAEAKQLTELDFVADVLNPIKLIAWGEIAMGYLGVRTVCSSYMFGVADDDMNIAAQMLLKAGFAQQTWSFSSTHDPATFAGAKYEAYCRAQAIVSHEYVKLDQNSNRFHYPDKRRCGVRIVLMRWSYIHLHIPDYPTAKVVQDTGGRYNVMANVYYPDASTLMESFIRVYLEDDKQGSWQSSINTWIIPYMYGQLRLGNDILDKSRNGYVKDWWNKEIDRDHGGLDMRCTKHDGRIL